MQWRASVWCSLLASAFRFRTCVTLAAWALVRDAIARTVFFFGCLAGGTLVSWTLVRVASHARLFFHLFSIFICTPVHMHAHVHTSTQTCTHIHTHKHTPARTRARAHTHTSIPTRTPHRQAVVLPAVTRRHILYILFFPVFYFFF